jgi:hypothetical protein
MDFCRASQYFTIDAISQIAFGESFGFLAKDGDLHDYIQMTESYLPFAQVVATFPIINDILTLPFLKDALMPSTKDKIGVGKTMSYVSQG